MLWQMWCFTLQSMGRTNNKFPAHATWNVQTQLKSTPSFSVPVICLPLVFFPPSIFSPSFFPTLQAFAQPPTLISPFLSSLPLSLLPFLDHFLPTPSLPRPLPPHSLPLPHSTSLPPSFPPSILPSLSLPPLNSLPPQSFPLPPSLPNPSPSPPSPSHTNLDA